MILNSPYISGSLTVTGNTTIQGQLTVTGSLSGTASLASNALLLQGTGSTGFATTASINEVSASQQSISASLLQVSASYTALSGSYNTFSGSASTRITVDSASLQQVSASLLQVSASYIDLSGSYTTFSGSASTRVTQIEQVYATTGSNSFRANQSITGSLVVSSTITAQTLIVQTVTSSIVYSSGSNNFGNQLANTQTFTGSVNITGSLTVNTTGTEFQVTNNGIVMGNLLADAHSVTGSLRVTGSNHSIFGNVLIGSATATGTERFGVTRDDGVTDGLHIIADFNRSGASSAELILGYYASGSAVTGPVVYASNSQPLLFAAGAQERMRITSGGNVGIGTASPFAISDVNLTVNGPTGAAIQLGYNGTRYGQFYAANDEVRLSAVANLPLTFYSNNLEKMRITSAGQIGINTTSPVSTSLTGSITIYKAYNADGASVPSTTAQTYYSNQHGLYLFGRNSGLSIISANSEEGSIKFANASTNTYATIATTTGTTAVGGDMYFRVGSDTERLRITSGGNVVLGASAAAFNGERLRVGGSTSASNPAMAITSANPNVSCPNGTATTVYTFPSYPRIMFYMVFVRFDTGTDANGYAAYAVVAASSVGSKLMTVVNGSAVTLTLSGLSVQINQSSGATQNAVVSVIQIFANGGSD